MSYRSIIMAAVSCPDEDNPPPGPYLSAFAEGSRL
jgi:hypothetical protein